MTPDSEAVSRRAVWTLFLVGACVIGFEILLTRGASAFFQYHFAFLVLSVAMFSLFASGVLYQRLTPVPNTTVRGILRALFVLLLPSPLLFDAALPASWLQAGLLLLGFSVLFCGSFITLHYLRRGAATGRAYAANLFGGAFGALLATVALVGGSPALGLVALGALAAVVVFLEVRRRDQLLLMFGLLAVSAGLPSVLPSPPNVLWQRWNAFSYVKVVNDRGPVIWGSHGVLPSSLDLLIDSSADTAILTGLGPDTRVAIGKAIAGDITHVGYNLAPRPLDVAIVGTGGGRDVVGAEYFQPREILAVEINPSVIEAVRRFSPMTYAGVGLVVAEGRSTLEKSPESFSLIQFGLVDTWAALSSGAFALSENYLYTREAFAGYLRKLKPDGILSITRWGVELPRLLAVATAALTSLKLQPPDEHLLTFEKDPESPYSLVTILVKKTPWTTDERQQAHQLAANSGFELRPYPPPTPLSPPAALDDSPFFFYDAQGSQLILLSIGVLTAASLALFFIAQPRGFEWRVAPVIFFGAIGMAYMLVENVYLQKFILLIRNPTLAVSTVFVSFLLFSGFGSLSWKRIPSIWLACLAPLLLLFSFVSGPLIASLLTLPLALKLLVTASAIAPAAFLMGLFFPRGFEQIQVSAAGSEGMAWAINGLFSVIAPPFALLLAVTTGFRMVLIVAASLYLAAYWAGRRL